MGIGIPTILLCNFSTTNRFKVNNNHKYLKISAEQQNHSNFLCKNVYENNTVFFILKFKKLA